MKKRFPKSYESGVPHITLNTKPEIDKAVFERNDWYGVQGSEANQMVKASPPPNIAELFGLIVENWRFDAVMIHDL